MSLVLRVCVYVCVSVYVCDECSCVPRNCNSYRQPQSKCSRLCFFIIDGGRSGGNGQHGRRQ